MVEAMEALTARLIGQPLWYLSQRPATLLTLAFGGRHGVTIGATLRG